MRQLSLVLLTATLFACTTAAPPALGDWPQWRGPDGTGAAPDAKTVDRFNLETGENVRWTTKMPGPSAGTPVIVGDRVFVAAGTEDTNRLLAIGIDRKTGEILWKDDVGKARESRERSRENNHAEGSPVADDKGVYFLFGSGDFAGYTHDGQRKWHINLTKQYGSIDILWGYASSPLLLDGKLYVQILRRQPNSLLVCIDPANGNVLWQTQRPTEALGESLEAYTSPIACTIDGKKQVVVYGGDALTGHDPETGKELWRFTEGLNPQQHKMFRVISGPTQGLNGLIYMTTPRGEDLFAVEVKDNKPTLKYDVEKVRADVPCPVYYKGSLYVFSGAKKQLFKFNADTGELIWSYLIDTPGYFRCTPTVADGKVYLINADGEMFILSAGEECKVLSHQQLGGYPTRATIAVAGNEVYIRTADRLISVGQ